MVRSGVCLVTRYFGMVCKHGMEFGGRYYTPVLRRIDLQIASLLLSRLLVA
jgi:hypothetical protein